MKALMNFQSPSSRVPFCASRVRTFEWFFTCVSQFMGLQVTFRYELLITLLAHKRALTSVGAHVCLEIACL